MGKLTVEMVLMMAVLVSGKPMMEDPSDPEDLNPIETMADPPRHFFKPLKDSGYEVEKGKRGDRHNILNAEDKYELNVSLRKFLDFLEIRGQKVGKNERSAISTMKLLIAQSWIFFKLEPSMSLMRGATAISVDETNTLDLVRKNILAELGVRNLMKPLADSILLYTTGTFQSITRDLKANIKTHRSIILDSKALLKIKDERLQGNAIKLNERHNALLIKDKILFQFHLITLKMILQSYIKLYAKESLEGQKKILIKSSDGTKNKEFTIPPLNSDQFEQLMLEASLEGEIDPEDELNYRPYTLDEYKKEQNEMIEKYYFETFGEIQNNVLSGDESSTTLTTVKLLTVQSWIHILRPDLSLVKKILPSENADTLERVKENIKFQLKKTMTEDEVVDSIVFYSKSLMNTIRDQLETKAQELVAKIEKSMEAIDGLSEGDIKKQEMDLRDNLVRNLEDMRLTIDFHGITLSMCVQSYVLDFLSQPYPSPVTLTSPRGQVTLPLPSLDPESFEELVHEESLENPDEI